MNFKNHPPRSIESVEHTIALFKALMRPVQECDDFASQMARVSQENYLAFLYEELEWVKSLSSFR
jgi:hypothetical protein